MKPNNKDEKKYETLMRQCLKLALKSNGKNMPNPYVGAIVFDEQKNTIISTGYHEEYGKNHAEVNAIENAKGSTKNKTLIVNLEPCSHWGKTPPCADLIIKSGFKKVVIGMKDINPVVKNNGIKKLKNSGIEVIVGILEKQCIELNKVFAKNILEEKPYVMLKTATTMDSKISTSSGKSKWITSEASRKKVQILRSKYQAIMSASGTILNDNPMLNVRIKNKTSPIRIIFDPNNKIPLTYNVFNDDGIRKILINNTKLKLPRDTEQISFDGNFDNLFKKLYELKIYSIMAEAGCGFNSQLLKHNQVDEINHFISPKIFGSGLNFVDNIETSEIEEAIELFDTKTYKIGNDILINAKVLKTNK